LGSDSGQCGLVGCSCGLWNDRQATGVKAIFSETSLPARAAETIGREAGVRVVVGEDALYGDALGPSGSDGDTYLKMVRHNTVTIVGNLSGA
jgi:manganese/iron transport system substrate-binding protein